MPNSDHRPRRSCTALVLALAAVAIFRAYAIATFGPIVQPDSADYLAYAKTLLTGSEWVRLASVDGVTSFRMIGYPAIIAAAQLAAGASFKIAVVILQSVLTLVAMTFLYRVGRRLGSSDWVAACAVLAYGGGVIAVFDLNILTDSLFANLAVITICLLALAILNRAPVTAAAALRMGASLAACILLREATLFASPFFALGAAAWGYSVDRSWKSGIRAAALFLLPTLILWQGYLAWNQYRSGYRFMTTGGQHAYLMKPVMVEQRGIAVLNDPRLRNAYAATASLADDEFFTRVREIGVHLYRNAKLNAVERTALTFRAYADAWLQAPISMLESVVQGYRANQFLLLINFNFAFRELRGLAGIEENVGYRAYFRDMIANPNSKSLPLLILELLGLCLSGIIFIGFVCGGIYGLWQVVRRGNTASLHVVPAWFLLLYVGFVGMYAMVHLELRYVICMQAIALIAGAAAIHTAAVSAKSYLK